MLIASCFAVHMFFCSEHHAPAPVKVRSVPAALSLFLIGGRGARQRLFTRIYSTNSNKYTKNVQIIYQNVLQIYSNFTKLFMYMYMYMYQSYICL